MWRRPPRRSCDGEAEPPLPKTQRIYLTTRNFPVLTSTAASFAVTLTSPPAKEYDAPDAGPRTTTFSLPWYRSETAPALVEIIPAGIAANAGPFCTFGARA